MVWKYLVVWFWLLVYNLLLLFSPLAILHFVFNSTSSEGTFVGLFLGFVMLFFGGLSPKVAGGE